MRIFNRAGKKFPRNSLSGFTLVEVLVAAVVLSLLLTGALAVLNISNATWNIDMGLVELQQQTRQAMAGMVKELRQAGSVNITTITPTQEDIDFSIPGSGTNRIRYYLDVNVGQILREYPDGSGATIVLANNIITLKFSGSDPVQIQLRAQKTVRGRTITFPGTAAVPEDLIEKVKLRN